MHHPTTAVRANPRSSSRAAAHFWRPFPWTKDHILCGTLTGEQHRLIVREEVQVALPSSPYALIDGRGDTTLIGPGRAVIVNRREPHRFVPLGGMDTAIPVIAFAEDVVGSRGAQGPVWFPSTVLFDDEITVSLRGIFDELQAPLRSTAVRSRLLATLGALVARHGGTEPEPSPDAPMSAASIRRLRAHLEQHAKDRISLSEMARIAMLSRFHLIRAFEREVGVSPRGYQMLLRLARALTLIAEGASLSFATFESGFADQAHMTRHFRRFFNLTPGEYARQTASLTIE